MVFSKEDAILIKNVYLSTDYGSRKLMCEFPDDGIGWISCWGKSVTWDQLSDRKLVWK